MAKSKKEASQQKPPRNTPSLEVFLKHTKAARKKVEMNGGTTEHHIDYTALHNTLSMAGFTATRSSVVQRLAKYNKKLKKAGKKYKFVAHRSGERKVTEQQFLATMDSMFDSDDT
jgi:hypothetical protein